MSIQFVAYRVKSYQRREVYRVTKSGKIILVVVILACCSGCTIHFKGEKVEFDAERQRVQENATYQLEKIAVFHGGFAQ